MFLVKLCTELKQRLLKKSLYSVLLLLSEIRSLNGGIFVGNMNSSVQNLRQILNNALAE